MLSSTSLPPEPLTRPWKVRVTPDASLSVRVLAPRLIWAVVATPSSVTMPSFWLEPSSRVPPVSMVTVPVEDRVVEPVAFSSRVPAATVVPPV